MMRWMMARWFIRNDPVMQLERQIQHLQQHNEHLRLQNETLLRIMERQPPALAASAPVERPPIVVYPEAEDLTDELYIPTLKVETVKVTTSNRTESFDEQAVDQLRKKNRK